MIALFLLVASAFAQPVLPELPRQYVNTSFLPVPMTTFTASTCATFQAAIDAAAAAATSSDVEVVLSDLTGCTGRFYARARVNPTDGWIWIHPANMGAVTSRGTRIGPSAAGTIPKLQTADTGTVFGNDNDNVTQAARLARKYWVTGFEFTQTGAQAFTYNAMIWSGSSDAGDQAGDVNYIPQDIVIDRCWVHVIDGDQNEHMGSIRFNVIRGAVIDSYISLRDAVSGGETQAILANRTPGPLKIVNNYLAGATENLMFGGGLGYDGITVSDVEFRWNFVEKPIAWRTYSPLPPAKNLFELKEGIRILVEENLFENSWQGGQYGFCLVLTPRLGQSGIWKSVNDITIRNNVCRHIGGGINSLAIDDGAPAYNMIVNVAGTLATWVSGTAGNGTSDFFTVESGMGVLINNAGPYQLDNATTLASGIDASQTTITLTQTTIGAQVGAILQVSGPNGVEKMQVTVVGGGGSRDVTRGCCSTSALAAASGTVSSINVATLSSSLGTLTNATLVSQYDRNQLRRVLVQNNLFDDVADSWGTPGGLWQFTIFNTFAMDRNTMINAASTKPPIFQAWQPACATPVGSNWSFTRNVFSGYPGGDCSPAPSSIYAAPYTTGYIQRGNNLLIGLSGPQQTAWTAWDATAQYAANEAAVGFSVDYKNITGSFASMGAGARLLCFDEPAIRAGTPPATECSPRFVRLQ